ncbi:myosin regulatory light chain cardiac muscle isoform-like protein [Labeo rohita]|uniref:Myosin regulatory light chain cardiac muscle isoform-like protein n=1 Tax=Labeo rohita TaxID=84645 RepID=A0A498N5U9_LABRO|nr:myosin regulatory light chain cardiac muscle isoform-like protein [Labeo rohita]
MSLDRTRSKEVTTRDRGTKDCVTLRQAPKKAKKKEAASSNVFSMFEQSQIQEFKEAFTIMDQNRDGFIDKNDLRDTFAALGTDPEETILNAFKIFDPEGTGILKGEEIKYHLMSQADKFTEAEVNQMFTNFPLDVAGNLDYKNLCYVITHGEDKEQE